MRSITSSAELAVDAHVASAAGNCHLSRKSPMHDVMTRSRSKISRQAIKKSAAPKLRKASQKTSRVKPAKGKWVYAFGGGKAEGRAAMRDLLGGKGAGLAEMAQLGLPVPPGFTITTEVCTYLYRHGKTYPKDLKRQVDSGLPEGGRGTGKQLGASENPMPGS